MKMIRTIVVDDSEAMRIVLCAMLARIPNVDVVAQYASPLEALAGFGDTRPGLIVTDVEMDGMDGFQLTRRVKALPSAPVVIVISASEWPDFEALALGAGADAFIAKRTIATELRRFIATLR